MLWHPEQQPATILSNNDLVTVDDFLGSLSDKLLAERLELLGSAGLEVFGGPVPLEANALVLEVLGQIATFVKSAVEQDQVEIKDIS